MHKPKAAGVVGSILTLCALLLITPGSAFGYVDPGTGAYLYQTLCGIALGGLFYLRKFFARLFGRRR